MSDNDENIDIPERLRRVVDQARTVVKETLGDWAGDHLDDETNEARPMGPASTPPQHMVDVVTQVFAKLLGEVVRQDETHPTGYTRDRNGIRLGLACAEDELREAREAWDSEKRGDSWVDTRAELVQVAGVVIRILRSLEENA